MEGEGVEGEGVEGEAVVQEERRTSAASGRPMATCPRQGSGVRVADLPGACYRPAWRLLVWGSSPAWHTLFMMK